MSKLRISFTGLLAVAALGVAAAPYGASAQSMAVKEYEVQITNLAGKEVLSAPLLATHPASAHVWQMGQIASDGLKMLAEEGQPDVLAASLKGVATDVQVGSGPIMPGASMTIKIKAHDGDVLSAAAMLVQTNDGFTGLDSLPLTGAMADKDAVAYDAGVEENTEKASDVPGPPFGGHNSGPQTDPRQPISVHPGISGKADVTSDYNWSGAVARFSVHLAMSNDTSMGSTSGTSMSGEQPAMGSTSGTSTGSTMAPGMPDTGHPAQTSGGDTMGKGDTMSNSGAMSEMPQTGAGDTTPWALLASIAGALLVVGFGLRRLRFVRR